MAERTSRRAWSIWLVAALLYLAAVFHRTSFGVLGLQAAQRFHIGPAALGVFTVLQIGVYALMQVPTGLLVDRFGPRAVIATAAVVMGAGQVCFAVATSYPLALFARAVLGVGDALTFVSMLRLVAPLFSARQFAVVTTMSAALGLLGNLAATLPLSLLLTGFGWTPVFLTAGLVTAGYAGVVLWRLRGSGAPAREPFSGRALVAGVRVVLRRPGTRLAFWLHFSTMFCPAVLGWLWGVPYLVRALGYPNAAASSALGILVLGALAASPVLAAVLGRRPVARVPLACGYVLLALVCWLVLLGWPDGRPPVAVVVVALACFSAGLPVSSIAFAVARDYNPVEQVGTATGVSNVGGFSAVTATALGIGLVLQFGPAEQADAFRLAFCVPVLALLLGLSRMLVWWRRARADALAALDRGEAVPVPVRRRRWDVPLGSAVHR